MMTATSVTGASRRDFDGLAMSMAEIYGLNVFEVDALRRRPEAQGRYGNKPNSQHLSKSRRTWEVVAGSRGSCGRV